MNAERVDVLGVLDGEIASIEAGVSHCRDEANHHCAHEIEQYQLAPLREARAAVAELLDSTAPLAAAIDSSVYDDSRDTEIVEIVMTVGELRRIRAAVVNAGGAA